MIYAIRAGDVAVKFGVAKDPEDRLKTLQTGCPHKLELIAVMDLPHTNERLMHKYLSEHRLMGEWFKPCEKVTEVLSDPRWIARWQKSEEPVCDSAKVVAHVSAKPPHNRWNREAYNAYQREYMRKRRVANKDMT